MEGIIDFPSFEGREGRWTLTQYKYAIVTFAFLKLTENLLNFAHCLNIHPYKDVITDRHGWVRDSVVNNGFHADGDRISRQDLRSKHSTGVLVQFFRRQKKPLGISHLVPEVNISSYPATDVARSLFFVVQKY